MPLNIRKNKIFLHKNKENIKILKLLDNLTGNAIVSKSEEKESRVSTLTLAQERD